MTWSAGCSREVGGGGVGDLKLLPAHAHYGPYLVQQTFNINMEVKTTSLEGGSKVRDLTQRLLQGGGEFDSLKFKSPHVPC